MNIVKKLLCICLAASMICCLAACSKNKPNETKETSGVADTTSKDTEKDKHDETTKHTETTAGDTTSSDTSVETQPSDTTSADTTSGETASGEAPSGGSPSGGTPSGGSPSGGSPSGGSPSGGSPSGGSTSGGATTGGDNSGGATQGGVVVAVGTRENPAPLVIGNNTASPNGSGEYFYSWTATSDTALVLEFSGAAGWSYQVNNLTAGANFTQASNSAGEATSPVYIAVLYGDSIQLAVNTLSGGAGNVTVTASVLEEWGTVNSPIPFSIGKTNYLRVAAGKTVYFSGRPYNTTMVLTGAANSVLSFDGNSHQFTGGAFSVQMPKSEGGNAGVMCFGISNYNGSTQEYSVTCNYPLGTTDNPAAVNLGSNTVQIEAGSQYGYIFEWTASAKGRVTITMTGSNWHYEILNINTMGQEQSTSSERPPVYEASVAVRAGQVIRITINSGDGNAATVNFNFSFS